LGEQNKSVTQPWQAKSGLMSSKLLPLYKDLPFVTTYILDQINALHVTADRENRFVYFQQTPDLQHTPELPQEASIMKPPAYVEPEHSPEEVRLIYNPKNTTSIFSGMITNVSNLMGQLTASTNSSLSVSEKVAPLSTAVEDGEDIPSFTAAAAADEQQPGLSATAPPVEK